MYKNIIFDLYGTILDVELDENNEYLWDKVAMHFGFFGAHYDPYELQTKYNSIVKKLENSMEDGSEIDIQDVFYKLFRDKKVKPKKKMTKEVARTFRLLSTKKIELFDGVEDVFKKLEDNKKNLYLVADGQHIYANAELKLTNLKKSFNEIYVTTENECTKKKLIENFFETEDLKKKECLLISSKPSDIDYANQLGVDTFELKDHNFEEALKIILN